MRKKIAVIDAAADICLLLTTILENLYDVVVYEDGVSRLAGISQSAPDLLILDIMLPGIDGPEVLRRLRADPALTHLPVIAFTGQGSKRDLELYSALGFDHYLIKPINNENNLLDPVARLLACAH
jgi:CheY-like chemotaxis protein